MPEFSAKAERSIIGGQAVIEGVMMRSKHHVAIAVRGPRKKIVVETRRINSYAEKYPFLGKPFIRGICSMYESLVLGMRALTFSANVSAEEDEQLSDKEIAFTMVFAVALSIGIFVAIPFAVSKLLTESTFAFNILDGILRMALFFLYILAISRMDDIQRVFAYHGAEHKTVHAYEAGVALTVKNTKRQSRLHPRCGTTFLLFVVIVSIVVFSVIPTTHWYLQFLLRIALLPFIAGISYEILRVSAKYYKNALCKVLIYPGLLLQQLTTREPTNDQLEVAICSLKKVLAMERKSAMK